MPTTVNAFGTADGRFGPLPVSPLVPGHEIVGRVT